MFHMVLYLHRLSHIALTALASAASCNVPSLIIIHSKQPLRLLALAGPNGPTHARKLRSYSSPSEFQVNIVQPITSSLLQGTVPRPS